MIEALGSSQVLVSLKILEFPKLGKSSGGSGNNQKISYCMICPQGSHHGVVSQDLSPRFTSVAIPLLQSARCLCSLGA